MSTVTYEHRVARIDRYKTGPKEGTEKPVILPKNAIVCGVTETFGTRIHYLVPVKA